MSPLRSRQGMVTKIDTEEAGDTEVTTATGQRDELRSKIEEPRQVGNHRVRQLSLHSLLSAAIDVDQFAPPKGGPVGSACSMWNRECDCAELAPTCCGSR